MAREKTLVKALGTLALHFDMFRERKEGFFLYNTMRMWENERRGARTKRLNDYRYFAKNSPNACTPASTTSPNVSAKDAPLILSPGHSANGQRLAAAARLGCELLEDDEKKRVYTKERKKK